MKKVILHVASGDDAVHHRVMKQIENILRELPDCNMEVAVHSGATSMLIDKLSSVRNNIISLGSGKNIQFVACRNSLNSANISAQDLIDGVKVVNSVLVYIIEKQQQGSAYIKLG